MSASPQPEISPAASDSPTASALGDLLVSNQGEHLDELHYRNLVGVALQRVTAIVSDRILKERRAQWSALALSGVALAGERAERRIADAKARIAEQVAAGEMTPELAAWSAARIDASWQATHAERRRRQRAAEAARARARRAWIKHVNGQALAGSRWARRLREKIVRECGATVRVDACPNDGSPFVTVERCHSRVCPVCVVEHRIRTQDVVWGYLNHDQVRDRTFRMLTFTIRNYDRGQLGAMLDELNRRFARMTRRRWWQSMFEGAIKTLEITTKGREERVRGLWHAHIHVAVLLRGWKIFVPWNWMASEWQWAGGCRCKRPKDAKIPTLCCHTPMQERWEGKLVHRPNPDCPGVDASPSAQWVSKYEEREDILDQLCKYVAKGLDEPAKHFDTDALAELILATRGRRMWSGSGLFGPKGIEPQLEPVELPFCEVCQEHVEPVYQYHVEHPARAPPEQQGWLRRWAVYQRSGKDGNVLNLPPILVRAPIGVEKAAEG